MCRIQTPGPYLQGQCQKFRSKVKFETKRLQLPCLLKECQITWYNCSLLWANVSHTNIRSLPTRSRLEIVVKGQIWDKKGLSVLQLPCWLKDFLTKWHNCSLSWDNVLHTKTRSIPTRSRSEIEVKCLIWDKKGVSGLQLPCWLKDFLFSNNMALIVHVMRECVAYKKQVHTYTVMVRNWGQRSNLGQKIFVRAATSLLNKAF